MFSSCMIRSGDVCGFGEGGVGMFVGRGDNIGYVRSSSEWSAVYSESCCRLDDVREDSDVGVEEVDELSSSDVVVVAGVTVSARERETKRP